MVHIPCVINFIYHLCIMFALKIEDIIVLYKSGLKGG